MGFIKNMSEVIESGYIEEWFDNAKAEVKEAVYGRRVIDKDMIRFYWKKLDAVRKFIPKLAELRKKSDYYDIVVRMGRDGSIKLMAHYPFTDEDKAGTMAERQKVFEMYGKDASIIVRGYELRWKVVGERVKKDFDVFQCEEYCEVPTGFGYGRTELMLR